MGSSTGSSTSALLGAAPSIAAVLSFAPASAPGPIPRVGDPDPYYTTQSVRVRLLDPSNLSHVIAEMSAERTHQAETLGVVFPDVRPGSYLMQVSCYAGPRLGGGCCATLLPAVTTTEGVAVVELDAQHAKRLASLQILPSASYLWVDKGSSRQLAAMATLADSSRVDVTRLADWSTEPLHGTDQDGVATMGARTGLLSGVAGGMVGVRAALGDRRADIEVAVAELLYQLPKVYDPPVARRERFETSTARFHKADYQPGRVYTLHFHNVFKNLPFGTWTDALLPGQAVGLYDIHSRSPVKQGRFEVAADGTATWTCSDATVAEASFAPAELGTAEVERCWSLYRWGACEAPTAIIAAS